MKFYKVSGPDAVVNYVLEQINLHLDKGEKVLWLLSGGSAISVEVAVSKRLGDKNLDRLFITLIDERYGAVGHADSNWQQLTARGFLFGNTNSLPVLNGKGFGETAQDYEAMATKLFSDTDYVLGLAGIGEDGHTLGIKPHSPALDDKKYVVGYPWEDYQRLSMTARAIKEMDEIVVYAMGEAKKPQLENLKRDLAAADQPAQLLKLAGELTIFNDQIE